MSKARDLANAGTALTTVSATELGYLDGVTSAVQTQVDAKIAKSLVTAKGDLIVATASGTVVAQAVGTNGQYLQADSTQADGVKWADVTTLPSQTGNSGKYLTTNGTAASWGTAGYTFTNRKGATLGANQIRGIAYNGSNLWVAVSNGGYLFSSPNAITWTSRTSGFGSTDIRGVAYGNGLFVAYGSNGIITTSTDGTTWTARTSGFGTNYIAYAVYSNSLWVAVGNGASAGTGGITTSTDGLTWTKQTVPTPIGTYLNHVYYANGYWVAVGGSSTNNMVYSTNGTSWTATADTSGGSSSFIYYNGTQWLSIGTSSYYYTASTPPSSGWTGLLDQSIPGANTNQFYNSKIYFSQEVSGASGGYLGYIFGVNPVLVNEASTALENPIIVPSGRSGSTISAIHISSAGIVYGDGFGRIYTSF